MSECLAIIEALEGNTRYNLAQVGEDLYDITDFTACMKLIQARELQDRLKEEEKCFSQSKLPKHQFLRDGLI